jgi:hypothetical protein
MKLIFIIIFIVSIELKDKFIYSIECDTEDCTNGGIKQIDPITETCSCSCPKNYRYINKLFFVFF